MAEAEEQIYRWLSLPPAELPEAWQSWVCEELDGAAREILGGDGSYKSVHLLLNTTGGGPDCDLFRPASSGASSGSFLGASLAVSQRDRGVVSVRERSQHAEDWLPEGADSAYQNRDSSPLTSCVGMLQAFMSEFLAGRRTFPDYASLAMRTAAHRWYHSSDE